MPPPLCSAYLQLFTQVPSVHWRYFGFGIAAFVVDMSILYHVVVIMMGLMLATPHLIGRACVL